MFRSTVTECLIELGYPWSGAIVVALFWLGFEACAPIYTCTALDGVVVTCSAGGAFADDSWCQRSPGGGMTCSGRGKFIFTSVDPTDSKEEK